MVALTEVIKSLIYQTEAQCDLIMTKLVIVAMHVRTSVKFTTRVHPIPI